MAIKYGVTDAGVARFAERFESMFASAANRNAARRYAASVSGETLREEDLEPEEDYEVAQANMRAALDRTLDAQSIDADEVEEDWRESDWEEDLTDEHLTPESVEEAQLRADCAKYARTAYVPAFGCIVEALDSPHAPRAIPGYCYGVWVSITHNDDEL